MKPSSSAVILHAGFISLVASCVGAIGPALAAGPAKPTSQAVMHTVQVAMPPGATAFAPGPGSDLANQHCVTCHSTGMVLRQPPLSFDEWKAEVAKMRAVYGAPLPADNIEAIARYLTAINGKD